MDQLVNIIKQPNWKILLTELVKSNDFDLWNVDLIKLTDLYLQKIKEMKEDNLLVPANALLAAAILLKLKAYSLKLTSIVDDEDELKIPKEDDLLNNINLENPVRFKEGQVSLDELIDVVDFIMNRPTKQNIDRKIKEKKEEVFVMPRKTEEINVRIKNLYSVLKNNIDEVGCTTFSLLAKDVSNLDLVDNFFIPLLFLNQDKKVNVWQEEFFSEIFIKVLN